MEGISKYRRDEEATRRAATAIGTRRHIFTTTTDVVTYRFNNIFKYLISAVLHMGNTLGAEQMLR